MDLLLASIVLASCYFLAFAEPDKECSQITYRAVTEGKGCCRPPKFDGHYPLEKYLKEVMFQNYDGIIRPCKLYENVVRDQDVMNDDVINENKAMAFFDKNVRDEEWKLVIKNAARNCFARTSSKMDELKRLFAAVPNNKQASDCNMNVMTFIECTLSNLFADCPAVFYKDTQVCNVVRASLDKCNANVENIILTYMSKVNIGRW